MKTLLKAGVAAVALSIGVMVGAMSASAQSDTASSADATMKMDKASFATAVASSNEFEIQSSKLAEQKSSNGDIKKFAEDMIKDHTAAGKEFMAAAEKAGVTPAKALNTKHAAILKELEAADGAGFDSMYVTAQTNAHMEAVTLFRTYSAAPDDETLGAFAKKTLPTLEKHLEHVKMLPAK